MTGCLPASCCPFVHFYKLLQQEERSDWTECDVRTERQRDGGRVSMAGVLEGLTYSRHSECGSVEPEEGKSECLCPGWGAGVTCVSPSLPLETGAAAVCMCVCTRLCMGTNPFNMPLSLQAPLLPGCLSRFGWVVWPSPCSD